MRVIGHRGAAAVAPENTLPAFEAAIAAGADAVELDARVTADSVVVVMHDDDVGRTTGARGRITDMTFAEVRALDASASFAGWLGRVAVPTLDEVLALTAGRIGLVIEVKATWDERGFGSAVPVVRGMAERVAALDDVVLSSFDPAAVQEARALMPSVRTALSVLQGFPLEAALAAAVASGHMECHPAEEGVDAAFVDAAHRAGITVACWTVNDPARALALQDLGVDAVLTDDPARIRAALDAS